MELVPAMLELTNLRSQSGKMPHLAVEQLRIETGMMVGVAGPNGSGKSTLLRAIGGALSVAGDILFYQRSLRHWDPLDRARHLAALPQFSQIGFSFTADEIVAMGMIPLSLSRQEGRQQVAALMKDTDCHHLIGRAFPSLSGGEKQRVHLARVLLQLSQATQPPLLVLDEPTSAQDLKQQHRILALARSLCRQRGYAVIAVLHDLNHVLRYCDHCVLMKEGRLSAQGKPGDVLTQNTIEAHWEYRPQLVGHMESIPVFV
ncbi:heme ABC transporter ATP-binding protein [uncultured Porticoccus sp.]|uniref:heme ABC transporter ATP-binding protein n=1 Tax=uncultured Porticoccus sp. TaxID=1256050 RepID=UPI0030DA9FB2|tara:strand:- start:85 stop:861 length:777 start_codon:yes stop_codon:yes gene_type:complete